MGGYQELTSARIVRALTARASGSSAPDHSEAWTLPEGIARSLSRANINFVDLQRAYCASGAIVIIVALSWGALKALALSVAMGIWGWLLIRSRARARERELDRDLPTLLTSVASSVRSGLDPLAAVLMARSFFPHGSVVNQAIAEMARRCDEEGREEQAIEGWLDNFSNPDVELFKDCLIISRRQGSSLADPLHRITRVVRQRQSFRRKTRSALAMHRMSAVGIALCAIVIGGIQLAMNPQGMHEAIHHTLGARFLCGGVVLIIGGVVWMVRIGSTEEVR